MCLVLRFLQWAKWWFVVHKSSHKIFALQWKMYLCHWCAKTQEAFAFNSSMWTRNQNTDQFCQVDLFFSNAQLTEESKKLCLRMASHDHTSQQWEWHHQAVVIHLFDTEIASVQRKRIIFVQRNVFSHRDYRHYRVINQGSHPESRFNCRISCRGKNRTTVGSDWGLKVVDRIAYFKDSLNYIWGKVHSVHANEIISVCVVHSFLWMATTQ